MNKVSFSAWCVNFHNRAPVSCQHCVSCPLWQPTLQPSNMQYCWPSSYPASPHLCASICAVLLTGLHKALLFTQESVQAQFLLKTFPGGSCLCLPQNLGGTFDKSTSNILLHRITTTSISRLHTESSLYGRGPRMTYSFAPHILAQYPAYSI